MFLQSQLTVRNLLRCLHNNAIVRQHVTYVSVISPTAVIARDLTEDYVQSKDESIWWLKPRVNRPARSVLTFTALFIMLCSIIILLQYLWVILLRVITPIVYYYACSRTTVVINGSIRFSLF